MAAILASPGGDRAERLTLAVLMCGVASLALSDFVSPFYWSLPVLAAMLRFWRGPGFALSEMQASFIGWFGFFWVGLELALGRALVVAFTDFLLILSLAIVVEAATPRNHLHRMLVGLFLVLGGAVLTDSVLYAVPLFALIWFLWRAASCLYGLGWPGGDLPAVALGTDGKWLLAMTAVTALLFVTLPRFEFHSLLKPTQPRMQTNGFADYVALGDFARELDQRVVLRVEPATPLPEGDASFQRNIQGRYWRGVALSRFTGSGWQKAAQRSRSGLPRDSDIAFHPGEGIKIAVYREASDHGFLQLPEGLLRLPDWPEAASADDAGSLEFHRPPSRRLRLIMEIGRRGLLPSMRPPLPSESSTAGVPEALWTWAAPFAGQGDESEVIARMASELRSWSYDLNAPIDAAEPVSSFLALRRGHCELYATTLALAARTLGVPARVVNGYYGGEWNGVGGFLLIRQKNAHSWVELWLDGRWQQIDATPPSSQLLPGVRFPAFDEVWEAIKLSWYRYVLEFQNSDRAELLKGLWQSIKFYALWLLALALAIATLAAGGRAVASHYRAGRGGWPLLDRWLARRGIRRRPSQPLRGVGTPAGISPEAWRRFVRQWEERIYAGDGAWREWELRRRLRALCRNS